MTQGVISRAEDQDYGNLAVNTILKIADGFDVAFVGEFVPYSELEHFAKKLSNKKFVASFEEEDQLKTKQRITGDNVLTKSVAINTYSGLQQEYGKDGEGDNLIPFRAHGQSKNVYGPNETKHAGIPSQKLNDQERVLDENLCRAAR